MNERAMNALHGFQALTNAVFWRCWETIGIALQFEAFVPPWTSLALLETVIATHKLPPMEEVL